MSPAPADTSDRGDVDQYAQGWSELMQLVRAGHPWSGGERNRFFLNAAGERFYEMSALSGLDDTADGRGLAIVDWDHDGRLDLWYRNRSAPRLRLMMNHRSGGESLAIRLEGTTANRDGIGAVVELLPSSGGKRLVRSVRAGDLFLSQSSKWLHFGLGEGEVIGEAEVTWPGGARERFSGVESGGRYGLQQGSGVAKDWQAEVERVTSGLIAGELGSPGVGGSARIILPARIPMPAISYRDQAARPVALVADGRPRLLILWSGTCPHCKQQLGALGSAEKVLAAAGLDVIALSVEGIAGPAADTSAAYDLVDEVGFNGRWGLIDAASAERVHRLQAALFDRTPSQSVPLAILLDQNANAVAIYRGPFAVKDVVQDWGAIRNADERQLYHLAPPLMGTWFTNPLGQRDVVRLIGALYSK